MPNVTADALVVGAGVVGLLVARELRRAGLRVTVLERDRPGRQASWASAGIVGDPEPWAMDPPALLGRLSVALYPALAADLQAETGIDVEYRQNGWIIPATTEEEAAALREEAARLQRAGFAGEVVEGAALGEAEPSLGPGVVAAQLLPGGNVENRRLVRALEIAETRAGTRIVAGAAVTEVVERGGRVEGVCTATAEHDAPIVVVAAGAWTSAIRGCAPVVPVVPQRGQILALQGHAVGLRRVVLRLDDPYLVPRVDGRLVVGATREFAGFDASLTAAGVGWLLRAAVDLIPDLAAAPIAELWTGFRPASPDGWPAIGAGALGGLYFATGHGPLGVTQAPATARVIAALATGQPSPVPIEAFSPLRFA